MTFHLVKHESAHETLSAALKAAQVPDEAHASALESWRFAPDEPIEIELSDGERLFILAEAGGRAELWRSVEVFYDSEEARRAQLAQGKGTWAVIASEGLSKN